MTHLLQDTVMTDKVNIMTDSGSNAQTVNQAVAARIKEHRKHLKLSLDVLAKKAGISKGMLVEIEKGSANPSIAILCKLSAALGISVADIVNVASNPTINVISKEDIPTLWNGEHGGSAKLLAGTTGPDMIELWRWVIKPSEHFESPGHPHGTFELFHVESGILTLNIDGQTVELLEGQSAIAKTDVPHSYSNQADLDLVFTMSVAELHR